jgi:hypothetical protein
MKKEFNKDIENLRKKESNGNPRNKNFLKLAKSWWLVLVILATWEAEIRRILV